MWHSSIWLNYSDICPFFSFCQYTGDGGVRDQGGLVRAPARPHHRHQLPARGRRGHREAAPGPDGARGEAGGARQVPRRAHHLPPQPLRPVRHRRPPVRRRPHRTQDHRGHVRRLGRPWRRRFLRQGLHQGFFQNQLFIFILTL